MKIAIVAALLFFILDSTAQKVQLPEYGSIDKAELTMTECSFDKNAEAMMIFNEAESYFKINIDATFPVFQQTSYRTRIKIFNKNGFDAANIRIRYPNNDNDVSIKNLYAQTYNLDAAGNIVTTKLDKSTVYDKKINARYSEKIFAFPDVKEGSVVEFKYTLAGSSTDVWYFQKSIPVKFSRFIVDFPSEIDVKIIPHYSLPVQKFNANSSYSAYVMQNIPGLRDEPYMSTREDYLQRIDVQPVSIMLPGRPVYRLNYTWNDVVKQLKEDEDFGRQLKKDIPRTTELDTLLQNLKDPYARMYTIHKYVRNNMLWDEYDNIWAMSGVKSAWKSRKGTSGEINLILINLLKDAGLDANPLLGSTRKNGIINNFIPGFRQFNKVYAHVQIGDKFYVLDGVEKFTPCYLIPKEIMASDALLIKKVDNHDWEWINLWDDLHLCKSTTYINAEINDKGTVTGSAAVLSIDYARVDNMEALTKGKAILIDKKFAQPGVTIDSLVIMNADSDTTQLIQSFRFTSPVNSSGEYNYFTVNLFSGLTTNPFIADQRDTDIFYGVNQEYNINVAIHLPDGYIMDELPKNIRMRMPDSSIVMQRISSFDNGLLSVSIVINFKTPIFTVDSYPEFKEFYKKLLDLLNEKFVYKKM